MVNPKPILMNLFILTLFFCFVNSICYDYSYTTINGSNIIPEGKTYGWLIFEPYNNSDDDSYDCSTIVYQFKNVTNEYHNNVISFSIFGIYPVYRINLFCENECNVTALLKYM